MDGADEARARAANKDGYSCEPHLIIQAVYPNPQSPCNDHKASAPETMRKFDVRNLRNSFPGAVTIQNRLRSQVTRHRNT